MPARCTTPSRVLLASALILLPQGPAPAQSVYEALFGTVPAQQAPAPLYVPAPYGQPFGPADMRPLRPRLPPEKARPRAEETSAPRAPVMPPTAKPARVATDKEIVASLMADSTLRRGDIVVFPDGPRIYRGDGGSSHKARDFEDLRVSRLVDESTRRSVLAGTRTTYTQMSVASGGKSRRGQRSSRPDEVAATGALAVSAIRR